MPRRQRISSASGFYHVIVRGNAQQLIFEDDADRSRFVSLMGSSFENAGITVLAWCLMSNHVHIVLDDPEQHLSKAMQGIIGAYARYFNQRYTRVGNLFEQRFGSYPIEDDGYLMQAIRYVLNNPVAAGIGMLEEYPWSSYQDLLAGNGITDTERLLDVFGGMEALERFCAQDAPSYDGRLEGRAVPDELALTVAREVLQEQGEEDISTVRTMPIEVRGAVLRRLRQVGISAKQIARLTGISQANVYRALHDPRPE